MTHRVFGNRFVGIEEQRLPDGRVISLSKHYVNPCSYQDMSKRLHVCETLFGDFNAELMILLQDAADTDTLDRFAKDCPGEPLHHGRDVRTNHRLVEWLAPFFGEGKINIEGTRSSDCGVYFANAVWLIKRGSSRRAPLEANRDVLEVCRPVLYATVQNLSRLKLILAFGKEAYNSIRLAYGLSLSWSEALDASHTQEISGGVRVGALNHPMASVAQTATLKRLRGFLVGTLTEVKRISIQDL